MMYLCEPEGVALRDQVVALRGDEACGEALRTGSVSFSGSPEAHLALWGPAQTAWIWVFPAPGWGEMPARGSWCCRAQRHPAPQGQAACVGAHTAPERLAGAEPLCLGSWTRCMLKAVSTAVPQATLAGAPKVTGLHL